MALEPEEEHIVECSDEELYDVKNRTISNHKGDRVWQPEGAVIAKLYCQIEKESFLPLKWTCPGRRPPSSHSDSVEDRKNQVENADNKDKSIEINQFDFDEEQIQNTTGFLKTAKRRSNQGIIRLIIYYNNLLTLNIFPFPGQRKVTKLDKVMNDMKKYNIITNSGSSQS